MKIFLSIFFLLFCFYNLAGAETFKSALKKAYENNSELNAERESINISKQELNVSKSAYLPTITVTGKKSEENTEKLTIKCDNIITHQKNLTMILVNI